MSPQKQYDYLFDKNINPTWQAWSLCLVLIWMAFAGWALWVNFQTIWEFGQGFFVLFLLISILIFSKILHLSSWFVCLGISFGHFVATENLQLKGFKYFGLIFLTNLGQVWAVARITESWAGDKEYFFNIPFMGELIIENVFFDLLKVVAPCVVAAFPLLAAVGLLITRKYLQNQLHDLAKINHPNYLLDAHLLDNDSPMN